MKKTNLFIIPNRYSIGGDIPEPGLTPVYYPHIGFAFDQTDPVVQSADVFGIITKLYDESSITGDEFTAILEQLNALDDDPNIPFVYMPHLDVVSLTVELNTWVEEYRQSEVEPV